MFNLVKNWRHADNSSKGMLYVMNIIMAAITLFVVLIFIPPPDSSFVRSDCAFHLIYLQLLFNIPLLFLLNVSGLLKRMLLKLDDGGDI